MRTDGYIFSHNSTKQGPVWRSPEGHHRCCLNSALVKARLRSDVLGTECDLDLQHLLDIYPKDGLCPVFGVKLCWGEREGRNNSPSLDRKDPKLGYLKGNVAFISNRANRIKSDATREELVSILSYLE